MRRDRGADRRAVTQTGEHPVASPPVPAWVDSLLARMQEIIKGQSEHSELYQKNYNTNQQVLHEIRKELRDLQQRVTTLESWKDELEPLIDRLEGRK